MVTRVMLYQDCFSENERELCGLRSLRASIFRYSTGVCGVRIRNEKGFAEILPFQGQQVWRAEFSDHPMTMKTALDEPYPTTSFFETYGGFLVHCGITAMGNPTEEDNHPQHGELPNARYDRAWVELGEDDSGAYIEISGEFRYIRVFDKDYSFIPVCRLYEDGTILQMNITLKNNRKTPLEYYYLCHINFRPEDGAELFYTADADAITVHRDIPENIDGQAFAEYIDKLEKNPGLHDKIGGELQRYDPEVVFTIDYKGDSSGKAHTIQAIPDGYSFYASHYPAELPFGIRWISRTGDEDALGMILPASAEHKGLKHCRESGYDRYLDPGASVTFHIEAGVLTPDQTNNMKAHIQKVLETARLD